MSQRRSGPINRRILALYPALGVAVWFICCAVITLESYAAIWCLLAIIVSSAVVLTILCCVHPQTDTALVGSILFWFAPMIVGLAGHVWGVFPERSTRIPPLPFVVVTALVMTVVSVGYTAIVTLLMRDTSPNESR